MVTNALLLHLFSIRGLAVKRNAGSPQPQELRKHGLVEGMVTLAAWVARLGYLDDAARLSGVAARGRRELIRGRYPEISALPEILGAEAFDAAFDAGAALDPVSSANMARELIARIRADLADE